MATPGFNHRILIKLTQGKGGRKMAFRWSAHSGMRCDIPCPGTGAWRRMKLIDAELFIDQDQAARYDALEDCYSEEYAAAEDAARNEIAAGVTIH